MPPMVTTNAGVSLDTTALAANWLSLKGMVGEAECAAVVKANAYGLGIENVAPVLAKAGCRTFFVAHAKEGVALRKLLPDVTIIVLHGIKPHEGPLFTQNKLTPVLGGPQDLHWTGPAWLHIDTGMNRLGFAPDELPERDNLLGLMSHLACADEPHHHMNTEQLRIFRAARIRYPALPCSLSASSGIFLGQHYHFNLVRPGIALYGGNPVPGQRNPMKPVVSVHVPVLQVRNVAAGETVGYGASFITDRPSRLAVIESGYADGLHRSLSTRGFVGFNGKRLPMVGRVSMDLIVVDATGYPVEPGDLIEYLGPTCPLDEVAEAMGTISYEVLTSLRIRA